MVDGDDSEVLDPGVSTAMIDVSFLNDVEKDPSEVDAAADKNQGKGSKALSAGKYLKDYLES